MNEQILYLLAGAVGALAFAVMVRLLAGRSRLQRYASALVVAAVLYVIFAARGESASGIGVELVGVAAFGGVAFLGLRRRAPGLLALGWALHPVWDVVLHTSGAGLGYTPRGYVAACIGFDLLVAALIARGWAGATSRTRAAEVRA
jgi:hypothetical protein